MTGGIAPTLAAAILLSCAALFSPCAPLLGAETVPSVETYLTGMADVRPDGLDPAPGGTTAGARLSLDTAQGTALKGSARMTIDSSAGLNLDRAYLKARFATRRDNGAFRLTLGKAPLSWGKGFVFNSGDPVFGAVPRVSSLTDSEYRTQTAWMAVAYIPFGDFSFAEAVSLPRVEGGAPGTESEIARAVAGEENASNRGGLRVSVAPGWRVMHSMETGVLASDADGVRVYIAVDGSLWVDWYCALSGSSDGFSVTESGGELAISAGLFRIFDYISGHPAAARLEAIAYPRDNRELWYPSIDVTLGDGISLLAQGLFATGSTVSSIARETDAGESVALGALPWLDSGSALLSLGVTWTLLDDIALSGSAVWRFEKGDDIPALGAQAGFTCTLR